MRPEKLSPYRQEGKYFLGLLEQTGTEQM